MEQLPVETTTYSMSRKPPAELDRRQGDRHLTLFRVGAITIDGRRDLCLVKNVSAGGALIRTYSQVKPKTRVEIDLKEGQPIAAQVSWVKGTDAGIAFDHPVDILDLLKNSGDGPRPRMPRIELNCVTFVREGATVHRSILKNISQGGCSLESANELTLGSEVTVSLPGLPPQSGVVRWSRDGCYGISFNTVLPLVGLVEWLHGRQKSAG